jgi:hypothetical protein
VHHKASTLILGVSAGSLGALLVGIGALLLLADVVGSAAGVIGTTYGGTLPSPRRRLGAGMEAAGGAIYVAAGSGLLLAASSDLTVIAVVVSTAIAAAIVYVVMALRLFAHHRLVHANGAGPRRSFAWCLAHPAWRPMAPTSA